MADQLPNSNNIFDVYKDYVKSADKLVETILKSNINPITGKIIQWSAKALTKVAMGINNMFVALEQIKDPKKPQKVIKQVKKIITDISDIIEDLYKNNLSFFMSPRNDKTIRLFIDNVDKLLEGLEELGKEHKSTSKDLQPIYDTSKTLKDIADSVRESTQSLRNAVKSIIQCTILLSILGLMTVGLLPLILIGMGVVWLVVKYLQFLSNSVKVFDKSIPAIKEMAKAIAMLGVATTMLVLMGMVISVGLKYFLIGLMVVPVLLGIFILISGIVPIIKIATKAIKDATYAIRLLSATAVIMVLTGIVVMLGWKQILATSLYLLLVVGLFFLIGTVCKDIIDKGAKELVYIALALMLLSLTVVMLATLGQFIDLNFENFLKVGALMAIIIGVFLVVAFFAKKIEKGGRELLYIAGTVFVLTLIALLLGVTGKFVNSSWGDICKVLLLLGGIVAAFVVIGVISSLVKPGIKTMLMLIIPLAVAIAAIYMIKRVVESTDMDKLWIGYGLMMAIVVGFAGVAAGLGAPGVNLLVTTGAAILIALCVPVVMIATSMLMIAKAMETLSKLDLDKDTIVEQMSIPIAATKGIVLMIKDIGVKEVKSAAKKMKQLSSITTSIGKMAKVLQQVASLKIPISYDEKGNPKEWHTMTTDDFTNAAFNCSAIASFFTKMMSPGSHSFDIGLNGSVQSVTIEGIDLDGLNNVRLRTTVKFRMLSSIVKSIGRMASTLQNVASLNIPEEFDEKTGKATKYRQMITGDFKSASKNVALIATTLVNAIADPKLTTVLDNMSKKSAKNFQKIMEPISKLKDITDLIGKLAGGMYVSEWEKDPKNPSKLIPKAYKKFSKLLNEKDTLSKNISGLISIIVDAVSEYNNGDNKSKLKDASKAIDNVKKVISGMTDVIDKSAKSYISSLKDLDITDFQNKIISIFVDLTNPIFDMDTSKLKVAQDVKIPTLKSIIELFNDKKFEDKQSQNYEKNVNNTIKLLDKIHKTDLNKLKYATSLVSKLNSFSKSIRGNFDALAKCINEDLVEALKKLDELLQDIKDNGFSTPQLAPSISSMLPTSTQNTKGGDNKKTNTPSFTEADLRSIKAALEKISNTVNGRAIDVNLKTS